MYLNCDGTSKDNFFKRIEYLLPGALRLILSELKQVDLSYLFPPPVGNISKDFEEIMYKPFVVIKLSLEKHGG